MLPLPVKQSLNTGAGFELKELSIVMFYQDYVPKSCYSNNYRGVLPSNNLLIGKIG